ncbi:MAG TPA: response regulator [Polyangiaceae bacterium]|nr:response regulator [Polyangiaceae bacterium]
MSLTPARVLVVDDSPTLRRLVGSILQQHGYDAWVAGDGVQALSLLERAGGPPDLALVDFVMPHMTGFEFCRRLRSIDAFRDVPVVLMSAKTDKIRDRFAEQTGAVDALSKPFDARALLAVVESTLRRAREGRLGRAAPALTDLPPSRPAPSTSGPRSGPESGDAVAKRLHDHVWAALEPLLKGQAREAVAAALSQALQPERLAGPLGPPEARGRYGDASLWGDGGVLPVGEMLQVLQLQRQSGVLHVRAGWKSVDVLYRDGLIDLAQGKGLSEEFRFGRYLVDEGLVAREALEAALEGRQMPGPLLGDFLVERGLLSPEGLRLSLVRQSSELVYEVVRWKEALFSFHRDAQLTFRSNTRLGLPVASLVMEGVRRVDEWRLIEEHIDFDCVLYRDTTSFETQTSDGLSLSHAEQAVLDAVDGTSTVREIIQRTNAGSFDVCKMLYQFLQSRLVRRKAEA